MRVPRTPRAPRAARAPRAPRHCLESAGLVMSLLSLLLVLPPAARGADLTSPATEARLTRPELAESHLKRPEARPTRPESRLTRPELTEASQFDLEGYERNIEGAAKQDGQNGDPDRDDDRRKRSSDQDWNKTKPAAEAAAAASGRVLTGDTTLNIAGAVRDQIGDSLAEPGGGGGGGAGAAATRLDAVVIRPAAAATRAPPARVPPPPDPPKQSAAGLTELLAHANRRVRIPCPLRNVSRVTWYKDNEPVSAGGPEGWQVAAGAVAGRAARGAAGRWRCEGGGQVHHITLRIYEPVAAVYAAVDGRRLDAGNTWVPAQHDSPLPAACHAEGGVPAPRLSWQLHTARDLDPRLFLRAQPTDYSREGLTSSLVSVRATRELHNATLVCECEQDRPAPMDESEGDGDSTPLYMEAKLQIHVTYPPSFVISRRPGFGVALRAGAPAALRCDVDANPRAHVYWQRDSADASTTSAPGAGGDSGATLRFPALAAAHGGWYRCRADWMRHRYSSIGYYLHVLPALEDGSAPPRPPPPPVADNVLDSCPDGGCALNASRPTAGAAGGPYRCAGDGARPHAAGSATARAVSARALRSGARRLECVACGARLRVFWASAGVAGAGGELRGERGAVVPEPGGDCYRSVIETRSREEVWCIAVSAAGAAGAAGVAGAAGAVAVFPAPPAPAPAPAPARMPSAAASLAPALSLACAAAALLCRLACVE